VYWRISRPPSDHQHLNKLCEVSPLGILLECRKKLGRMRMLWGIKSKEKSSSRRLFMRGSVSHQWRRFMTCGAESGGVHHVLFQEVEYES
jgi:hypothetical protein